MSALQLHHVSISVSDLDNAMVFYHEFLELDLLERPPFPSRGAWLACGACQVHLNPHPPETLNANRFISPVHPHFALRAADFDYWTAKLANHGYSEDLPADNSKKIRIDRNSLAGFPQLYLTDPDCNIIEINSAPM